MLQRRAMLNLIWLLTVKHANRRLVLYFLPGTRTLQPVSGSCADCSNVKLFVFADVTTAEAPRPRPRKKGNPARAKCFLAATIRAATVAGAERAKFEV